MLAQAIASLLQSYCYYSSERSATKKIININARLFKDGPERALGHIPCMIGYGGVSIACRAIPDLMRTGRLAIKGKAYATQLFSDFAVTKA